MTKTFLSTLAIYFSFGFVPSFKWSHGSNIMGHFHFIWMSKLIKLTLFSIGFWSFKYLSESSFKASSQSVFWITWCPATKQPPPSLCHVHLTSHSVWQFTFFFNIRLWKDSYLKGNFWASHLLLPAPCSYLKEITPPLQDNFQVLLI